MCSHSIFAIVRLIYRALLLWMFYPCFMLYIMLTGHMYQQKVIDDQIHLDFAPEESYKYL